MNPSFFLDSGGETLRDDTLGEAEKSARAAMAKNLRRSVAALRSAKYSTNVARGYLGDGQLDGRLEQINFDLKVYEDELSAMVLALDPRPECVTCSHRHLSAKHGHRCPHCPCVVRA